MAKFQLRTCIAYIKVKQRLPSLHQLILLIGGQEQVNDQFKAIILGTSYIQFSFDNYSYLQCNVRF